MPNTIKTKGFSLVEAAIVLGVVGLVIGGIWVAASAISSTLKVNRAVTGILQTADNLRRIVPRSVATGSWINISTLAVNSDAVAKDLLVNGVPKSPWGLSMAIGVDGDSTTGYIQVGMRVPTKADCLRVTSRITSTFKDNSYLQSLEIGSGPWTQYTNWPLSPTGTQCDVTYPTELAFQFAFAQ